MRGEDDKSGLRAFFIASVASRVLLPSFVFVMFVLWREEYSLSVDSCDLLAFVLYFYYEYASSESPQCPVTVTGAGGTSTFLQ
jgi:hypothetical protein